MAYVEAGRGDPILMLHGEPTWGFLYRHMIPPLAEVRTSSAFDLINWLLMDKPSSNAYSYKAHAMAQAGQSLDLQNVTLVCQDWGGLLGLRVLAQMPERFKRLVAMNTGIPTGEGRNDAFLNWRRLSQRVEALDVPRLIRNTLKRRQLSDAEAAAYAAPFPSREYQTGVW